MNFSLFYVDYVVLLRVNLLHALLSLGFEDEEQDRLEFFGVDSTSPIDGSKVLYYSDSKKTQNSLIIMVIKCSIDNIFKFDL